jgi:pimeloyl-ACP methyl ester carboxylesterase
MPRVDVAGLTVNYDVQGGGEPLLLIPYLSADHACYAFQLPAYTEHFSCIALDLPGTGESAKPAGPSSSISAWQSARRDSRSRRLNASENCSTSSTLAEASGGMPRS